jgi:hypothetical protein
MGSVCHQMIGAMQDPANGFRRIHHPGTLVNEAIYNALQLRFFLN